MRSIVAFAAILFASQICHGWSEGGHHLIGEMAFDELSPEIQTAVIELLRSHPRLAEDFKLPEKAGDNEHYWIGRAAYWPDVARSQKEYHRSSWHYQLGPVLVLDGAKAPDNPGRVPKDASLNTQDLHIAQAVELCRSVLRDKTRPAADRAIALCWIAHLVGDAHQPCHSGSLYCELFPDGDRGGNSIPTVQSRNMHSLWDSLLGPRYNAGDLRRRAREIRSNVELWTSAKDLRSTSGNLDPLTWLLESQHDATESVYTAEVLTPIETAKPGDKLESINLSEGYLKNAGAVAQRRAAFAAQRLAEILKHDLAGE